MGANRQQLRCFVTIITVLAAILTTSPACSEPAQSKIVFFAAASTAQAVTEAGELFASRNGIRIIPSFASSSTLAKQIANGAPADLYLSANSKWMDYLEKKNRIVTDSRFDLMGNRIVLITPADAPVKQFDIVPGLSLAPLLGRDGRLALGDPTHVPAGIYGRKALQHLKIWDQVKNRLAPMKDVLAALVLVERGETPLGLVYATEAVFSAKVRVVGTFPAESHPAIVYPVAAVSGRNTSGAKLVLEFLSSPEAQAIFSKYGFIVR